MSTWDSQTQREALLTRVPEGSRSKCVKKVSSERNAGGEGQGVSASTYDWFTQTHITYFDSVMYIHIHKTLGLRTTIVDRPLPLQDLPVPKLPTHSRRRMLLRVHPQAKGDRILILVTLVVLLFKFPISTCHSSHKWRHPRSDLPRGH
jgi:hypothetical protein